MIRQTNNPFGRPKGTPNKVTTKLKQFIADLIDKNREQILKDIASLEPRDRLNVWLKLLEYTIPKATTGEEQKDTFNSIQATIDQLNQLGHEEKGKEKVLF